MEGGINPDATLDYVEFDIFPSQNRYEASVWSGNREEKVSSGTLELSLLSPEIKKLSSKGSNQKFKILPPDNIKDAGWFTTATLTRFLHITGLPDILSIEEEISQLKEARKFQLSLSDKAQVDTTTSVESKNELLLAVDLRLTALEEELAAVINHAIGSKCSPKDIFDLGNFALHFGAKDLRDSLQKYVELSTLPSDKDLNNGSMSKPIGSAPMSPPPQLDPLVKYGVPPAKVVNIEGESSTDDEDSTFSSEEDQAPVERSRSLARSAMPRRSASPMRRIQIGRSGSRRAAALSIKSLNHFPAREKLTSQRDAAENSSEEEDTERPPKNNVLRLSVQDKISLFESKQRDQGVESQTTKKSVNVTVGANKAVLRRWSSGMAEKDVQCLPDTSIEISVNIPTNIAPDGKTAPDNSISNTETCVETETIISLSPEKGASEKLGVEVDKLEPEREESCEKPPASIESSQQKGAELKQLSTELMESKPVRQQKMTRKDNKVKIPKEQRGGFYDQYKKKREEKLQEEAAGKKVEKGPVDERKATMASTNMSGANRRHAAVNESQKTQMTSTQLINSKTTKPSDVKKSKTKSTPLHATRKSWPSTPSSGTSSARTLTGPTSTSTTPTNRKPYSTASVVRPSTKVESLQPQLKTLKATQPDANKRIKAIKEKQQPTVIENKKTTKTKVQAPNATAKPSFYNKVTKKSSVVPLETKPFLRKGSGVGPGVGSIVSKPKVVTQTEEALRTSGGLIQSEENNVITRIDIMSQNLETECEMPENRASLDLEPEVVSPAKCEESESSTQLYGSGGGGDSRAEASENAATEEELEISPTAWVEIEEHHQNEIISCKESPIQIASPANVIAPAGFSRVRHSLSQMLFEESNEADIGEWGNAEHPPTMVYQKDTPRGFKRLLKFARKSKADSHLTGWSSPSAFSEGEDDAEESKGQSKFSRFTAQNHRKVTGGHVSASMNTTKATRSFFSLSALRGNKTSDTKLLHR